MWDNGVRQPCLIGYSQEQDTIHMNHNGWVWEEMGENLIPLGESKKICTFFRSHFFSRFISTSQLKGCRPPLQIPDKLYYWCHAFTDFPNSDLRAELDLILINGLSPSIVAYTSWKSTPYMNSYIVFWQRLAGLLSTRCYNFQSRTPQQRVRSKSLQVLKHKK